MIQPVLTPTSCAAALLAAVAMIALPTSVFAISSQSASTMAPTPISTIRLCGNTLAPPIWSGVVPAKPG